MNLIIVNLQKLMMSTLFFFWFWMSRILRNVSNTHNKQQNKAMRWGYYFQNPYSEDDLVLPAYIITPKFNLPLKVYRCQGAQCLEEQLSTLPQHLQVGCCPNSTRWLTPNGPLVIAPHFFLRHHLPPRSGLQSLTLWGLRDPKDKAEKEESVFWEHIYTLQQLTFTY